MPNRRRNINPGDFVGPAPADPSFDTTRIRGLASSGNDTRNLMLENENRIAAEQARLLFDRQTHEEIEEVKSTERGIKQTSKAFSKLAEKIAEAAWDIIEKAASDAAEFSQMSQKTLAGKIIQRDPIDDALAVASSYGKAGATLSAGQTAILGEQVGSQYAASRLNTEGVITQASQGSSALQNAYGAKIYQGMIQGRAGMEGYERERFLQEGWKYIPTKAAEGLIELFFGGSSFPATERGTMNVIRTLRNTQKAYQLPLGNPD